MSRNLYPTEDNVIVVPYTEEKKTTSGILMLETPEEKPKKGQVIATGPGKMLDNGERGEMVVKIGDIVHFGKYTSDEIVIMNPDNPAEEITLYIVRHANILAIEK